MEFGAITSYIDVAQLTLYAFWIFFAALIWYLHRENKREGYPLDSDRSNARVAVQGFPKVPAPKTFKLAHGGEVMAPRGAEVQPEIKAVPMAGHPGAALIPTGDPMQDGVGPAAYAMRADTPDLTVEGHARIVPLRVATDHSLEPRDINPIGLSVVGADRETGGVVRDAWVDRSEAFLRYLEVEVAGGRRVLLPITFAIIKRDAVYVKSVLGEHFARAPGLKNPDTVTLREEDRIAAYYAGGTLYATPARQEPIF